MSVVSITRFRVALSASSLFFSRYYFLVLFCWSFCVLFNYNPFLLTIKILSKHFLSIALTLHWNWIKCYIFLPIKVSTHFKDLLREVIVRSNFNDMFVEFPLLKTYFCFALRIHRPNIKYDFVYAIVVRLAFS